MLWTIDTKENGIAVKYTPPAGEEFDCGVTQEPLETVVHWVLFEADPQDVIVQDGKIIQDGGHKWN